MSNIGICFIVSTHEPRCETLIEARVSMRPLKTSVSTMSRSQRTDRVGSIDVSTSGVQSRAARTSLDRQPSHRNRVVFARILRAARVCRCLLAISVVPLFPYASRRLACSGRARCEPRTPSERADRRVLYLASMFWPAYEFIGGHSLDIRDSPVGA